MNALAELFPGTWKPLNGNTGYRFEMRPSALRSRADWWRLYLAERKHALQQLRVMNLQAMQEGSYVDSATTSISASGLIRVQVQPGFFNLLPPDLQRRIASHLSDLPTYRTPAFVSSVPKENAVVVRLAELPVGIQNMAHRAIAGQNNANPAIYFYNAGFLILAGIADPEKRPWRLVGPPLRMSITPTSAIIELNHSRLAELQEQARLLFPASWNRLLQYQRACFWPNDAPNQRPTMFPPKRRSEILEWLGERAGVEFVADYYSQNGNPMSLDERNAQLSRSLKEELDFLACEQDMSWRQQANGLYLFRNNRWYRDDLLEVPNDKLNTLQKHNPYVLNSTLNDSNLLDLRNLSSLEAQLNFKAEITKTLSLWQIANGLFYFVEENGHQQYDPLAPQYPWRPFASIARKVVDEYQTVQFYADLTAQQRKLLIEGKLPYATLSVRQKAMSLRICPEMEILLRTLKPSGLMLSIQQILPSVWGSGTMHQGMVNLAEERETFLTAKLPMSGRP